MGEVIQNGKRVVLLGRGGLHGSSEIGRGESGFFTENPCEI